MPGDTRSFAGLARSGLARQTGGGAPRLVDRLVCLQALRAPQAVRRAAKASWRRRWWALRFAARPRLHSARGCVRPAAEGEPPAFLPLRGQPPRGQATQFRAKF